MKDFRSLFRLVLPLTLFCPTVSTSADTPSAWKKPVEFTEGALVEEELVAVPLDATAYSRTSDNFFDLRILDAAGNEVPWRILKQTENRERIVEDTWTAENLSLKPTADGLDIRFSLHSDDPQPTGLRIETPLKDFEQRVRVFGLQDDEEALLADEAIFDYSQYMDIRRVDIPLGENSFRSFRIVVDQLTSEQESHILSLTRNLQGDTETARQERFSVSRRPFRIDRIRLAARDTRLEVKSVVEQRWETTIENISEDTEARRTVVEFTSSRQPLTRLRLMTSSRNFGRSVHLEVPQRSTIGDDWTPIASGTISRLKYREIEEQQLELSFPETRSKTYRLIIENRDSPPLTIDGLEAFGHVYQLLFLAQPEASYDLQYGRQTDLREQPEYDTVAIDRLVAAGVAPLLVQLGKETEDSRVSPPGFPTVTGLVNNPVFLVSLILIMAGLLAWALFGALKRVDTIGSGDRD